MMPHEVARLIDAWAGQGRLNCSDLSIMHRLMSKAEISRKLFVRYNDDFTVPDDVAVLAYGDIEKLMLVLLHHIDDLKCLNAALKIADGVLIAPDYRADAAMMARLESCLAGVKIHANA